VANGVGLSLGRSSGESRVTGSAIRKAGRVALWALVVLLLFRGLASVLSGPEHGDAASAARGGVSDPATSSFAVRFARTYLADSSPQALAALLAPGAAVPASPSPGPGTAVEQAEVAGVRDLGSGQAIITVACELDTARTLYLAVPIVREDAGEVAALGVPAIVAGPAGVGASVEPPRPLAGPDAGAIADLSRRFVAAYLSATDPRDLAYLLAPGAAVTPLGGGLELLAVSSVKEIGPDAGARPKVVASARVREPMTGRVYPIAYRLEVVRRDHWYVQSIEGALS
jgi:hypothetical protein